MVVRNLGVQITTKYRSGNEKHVFLEHESISDVLINEAFYMYGVITYMGFVVKNRKSMVLAFEVCLFLFLSQAPSLDLIF